MISNLKISYSIFSLLLLLLLLLFFWEVNALARPLIADSFPRKINIDHDFTGVDVLVYGARNDAGNIYVVVRGPKGDYLLRKKGRAAGIWTNVANIELENFYSFYAIASMQPLENIKNNNLIDNLDIGYKGLSLVVKGDEDISEKKTREYKDAAISMMQINNLYSEKDHQISFWGETLFRTFIEFPKNIVKGIYHIDIYLFSDGVLQAFQTMPIIVEKVGFEAFVHGYATSSPALYGIICVFIALFFGWVTAAIFGRN